MIIGVLDKKAIRFVLIFESDPEHNKKNKLIQTDNKNPLLKI